jgi:16S rRNA (uracil1498-N3)-methyltransferase
MPQADFRSPRLFVDAPFAADTTISLDRNQSNYLGNVLRLGSGASVLVFNGKDGEWQAAISGGKRADRLTLLAQTRPQDHLPDVTYVFAPLKHARLDYMVQKAIEMGAAALQPVMTRFTQASRVNTERMRANVVEAAEQCGILSVASVAEPLNLPKYLDQRDAKRLTGAREAASAGIDVLIGPEGGFADEERALLLKQANILRLALGPRIMRADTAAVAALALVQTALGDWNGNQVGK